MKPPRPADNLTLALDLSSPFSLDEPPYIAIENSRGSSCSGGTLWTTKDGRAFLFGDVRQVYFHLIGAYTNFAWWTNEKRRRGSATALSCGASTWPIRNGR